jgi:YfiH family protein
VLFLTSKLLDAAAVPHGFSLRTGGVSLGPFESLNLSEMVGDQPQAVAENMRRLQEAADLASPIATANQVHGDRIVDASLREILAATEPQQPGADALISDETPVGTRGADCPCILLAAGRKVAAVHSGWRGTRLKIAKRVAELMRSQTILAAIGPCIGLCCYQVSKDLADQFRQQFGPRAADHRDHLDLRFCIESALREAGVEKIEQVPGCTSCDAEKFFSHRRDKGRTGRHLAFISPPE